MSCAKKLAIEPRRIKAECKYAPFLIPKHQVGITAHQDVSRDFWKYLQAAMIWTKGRAGTNMLSLFAAIGEAEQLVRAVSAIIGYAASDGFARGSVRLCCAGGFVLLNSATTFVAVVLYTAPINFGIWVVRPKQEKST
jgi:hypothetical protein